MLQYVPYFSNIENIAKLERIMQKWLGVRYKHMGENEHGVDCTKLLGLIFLELGIFDEKKMLRLLKGKYYAKDWHVFSRKERVLESIEESRKALIGGVRIRFLKEGEEKIYGDVLLISLVKSGVINHTAIYLKDFVFHVTDTHGVIKMPAKYWLAKTKRVARLEVKK